MIERKKSSSKVCAHILMVDENAHGLTARKAVLEEQGYEVTTTKSAHQARELFGERAFDLLITDHKPPKVNGLDLAASFREAHPSSRVIILSGIADALGLTVQSTGVDAVLQKSAHEVPQLIRVVARVLSPKPAAKRKAAGSVAAPPRAKKHSA